MKKYFIVLGFLTALFNCAFSATITSKTTGGNWSLPGTWTGGAVPGTNDDVVIAGTVTLNTNASVKAVTINSSKNLNINSSFTLTYTTLSIVGSGALSINSGSGGSISGGDVTIAGSLTLNANSISVGSITNNGTLSMGGGGTINLTGNFTNNANFNTGGAGMVSFNGSSIQTIDGGFDFVDITISNGASVTLSNTAAVNLNGVLLLVGTGAFDADGPGSGVFTVVSSSLQDSGLIDALPTPSNFSGNVTIQRFIDGKTGGDYRYISIPVKNAHADVFTPLTSIGITGNFSDHNVHADFSNITDSGNTNPSVFSWNPSSSAYVALDGGGGSVASTTVDSRTGYVAYNFSDADATISATGQIEAGNSLAVSVGTAANSFSLIPNIYPCPIHWDKVYTDNGSVVTGAIWWRTGNGAFNSYVGQLGGPPGDPATGNIAIGQSFWVQAPSGGSTGTLIYNEAHKTNFGATFVRKQVATNYFWISLSSSTQKDYAAIRFNPSATDEQDAAWDAVKRKNGNPISKGADQYTYLNLSSYTTSPSKDYAINSVSEINGDTKTIGLIVNDVTPGNYTIGFVELSKLQLGYKITLIDQLLNKETSVEEGTSYSFSVTGDTKSYGDARFKLRFDTRITGLPESTSLTSQMAYPNPTSSTVTVNLPKELDATITGVKLYDTQGNLLLTSDKDSSLLKQGEKTIDLSAFKSGVYILNITSGLQMKSIRLIRK